MLNEFFSSIFDGITNDERICLTLKTDDGWQNYPATQRRIARFEPGSGPWYFGVCSFAPPNSEGYFPRGRDDARFAYCLVLDDVGTKAKAPAVAPSWILESSEGNYQWGYLIDPLDVSDSDNEAYYEACQRALAEAGYNDPGACGTYRVMRVPGSLHKTGFVARVTESDWSRFWALPDLMSELGLTPVFEKQKRTRRTQAADSKSLADVKDEVYDWLRTSNLVVNDKGKKFVSIVCPWHTEHTSGDDTAGYTPAGYDAPEFDRAFNCLHEHCMGRGKHEFLDWVAEAGGPDVRVVDRQAASPMPYSAPEALTREQLPDYQTTDKGNPKEKQLSTDANINFVMDYYGLDCRYNIMTRRNEYAHPTWDCADLELVHQRLSSELQLVGIHNDRRCEQALVNRCKARPYHPMSEWLSALPEWDGEDRLQVLEDSITTDSELWPVYLRKWLVQVVEGVTGWRRPKQLSGVLVFVGPQGMGKSTWFKQLITGRFFQGEQELHLSGFDAKDQQLRVLSTPITELAELDSSFKKSEAGALKAFLSRSVDSIRAPYAREPVAGPRCTVFCASVNDPEFLVDKTGSRRFWPVDVTGIKHDLGLDIEQLWAQIVVLHKDGYGWLLSKEQDAIRDGESSKYYQTSAIEDAFYAYFGPLLSRSEGLKTTPATVADIAILIGLPPADIKHPVTRGDLVRLLRKHFGQPRKAHGRKVYDILT